MKSEELKIIKETILVVDDDQVMLKFWSNILERKYDVYTAESALEGLSVLKSNSHIKVIVSDNQMPDVDGISFLAAVKEAYPCITRILITAHANLESAINSINKGAIFRFLMKPCEVSDMLGVLKDGIEHYDLKKAEKDLLENTLTSSIEVLTDILGIVSPLAFSRTNRLSSYAVELARIVGIEETWEIEIAARLSQTGCLSVPKEILQSVYSGIEISDSDKETYVRHTEVGSSLIGRIPRLERVSKVIACQNMDYKDFPEAENDFEADIYKYAQILRVVFEFERLRTPVGSVSDVVDSLLSQEGVCNPAYVHKLPFITVKSKKKRLEVLHFNELIPNMTFAEDVVRKDGFLLIPKGHDVTPYSIEMLANLGQAKEIDRNLKVFTA